jgi:hypothetical protein
MVNSFVDHGFVPTDCEYFFIDNRVGNEFDAYQGFNQFLLEARGRYVIICHQDVVLLEDDRSSLEDRLAELDSIDPTWAVCGNAGGIGPGKFAIRISDPWEENRDTRNFPARVSAVDENFIVIRRDANLALARDVSGFHLYGSALSIVADILGHTTWVIDFHLRHKSGGNIDREFFEIRKRAIDKWGSAFRPRWIVTPTTSYLISGLPGLYRVPNYIAGRSTGKGRRLASTYNRVRARIRRVLR